MDPNAPMTTGHARVGLTAFGIRPVGEDEIRSTGCRRMDAARRGKYLPQMRSCSTAKRVASVREWKPSLR
jgi:hypothetical protein